MTAAPAAKKGAASMTPMKRRWRWRSLSPVNGRMDQTVATGGNRARQLHRIWPLIELNSTHSHSS